MLMMKIWTFLKNIGFMVINDSYPWTAAVLFYSPACLGDSFSGVAVGAHPVDPVLISNIACDRYSIVIGSLFDLKYCSHPFIIAIRSTFP